MINRILKEHTKSIIETALTPPCKKNPQHGDIFCADTFNEPIIYKQESARSKCRKRMKGNLRICLCE